MLYIYLNLQKIIEAGGTIGPSPDGKGKKVFIKNLAIHLPDTDDIHLCDSCNILQYTLPNDAGKNWVTKVSFHDSICPNFVPKRQLGEYNFNTAHAVLDKINGKHYHLEVTGKTLEDAQELYRLICEGKIWPVGDYEAEMVPSPCRHVRELLRELWAVIRRDVSHKLRKVSMH